MPTSDATLRAGEMKKALLEQIDHYEEDLKLEEVGEVLEVKDGVARIWGLSSAVANEMLEIESSETGELITALALNLEEDNIGAVVMGDYLQLKEGDSVRRTGRVLEVPVGPDFLGRVVNPLGEPLDGKGAIKSAGTMQVDRKAPGIVYRQPVNEPLQTGIKAIDSMIPIGRGQRELIIGDRQTGKTAIAIDTIINQQGGDVVCVYVAIGQKASTVASVVARSRSTARWTTRSSSPPTPRTRRRCSTSRPTPAARWPSTSCTRKAHTLVIYDDLSKQADAYRQISLLLRRPPGREAYPGRRVLPAQPAARARRPKTRTRRARGRRVADRAADHRDPGRRRVGLHPDQRHLDHRRPDLPRERPVLLGRPSGRERRHLGVARGWRAQIKAMKKVAGRCGSTWPSTASSRPSRSSAPTWTRRRSASWPAASARSRCSSRASTRRWPSKTR